MQWDVFYKIKKECSGYFAERIFSEILFAKELCVHFGISDTAVDSAVTYVVGRYAAEKCITCETCMETENILLPYAKKAKSLTALCVAHAHMDMNWLWGFNETVAIVLSTCRTMLDLMKEYKDFTFSQSQAAIYRIIEEYDAEMLAEIKERVKEGRWEISASTWVENDKNMPNGEGQVMQYRVAKEYLSKLFGIEESSLDIDFEPDTFGHSENMPEIMRKCGIKYFYHCRGDKDGLLYNWESPSGSRVLAYREPEWYNADVSADFFLSVPGFTAKYAVSKALKVYGVGDHGGGATRKDLDILLDIATWPIMPTVKFSSYKEFFKQFKVEENEYEVVTGELNYIFDGCYTSQSRIKAANKRGEKFFKQVEELGALCYSYGINGVNAEKIEEAWKIHLFNHFHDIIPGSGVFETTEYAMGQAQVRDAVLGCENTSLLKRLASKVETKRYGDGFTQKTHMGAGIGFYTGNMVFSGGGDEDKTKIFMLYNPSLYSGIRCYEITLWDCFADTDIVTYDDKARIEHAFIDNEAHEYWGHKFRRMYVAANVPPKGYKCIIVKRKNEYKNYVSARLDLRKQNPPYFVLENEYICAQFDGDNGALLSLKDKKRNETLSPNAGFNFVKEGTQQGMNAWLVGSRKKQTRITSVNVSADLCVKNELFQTFGYRAKFADSDIQVRYILKKYSPFLEIETTCNFNETGKPGDSVPALEYEISADTKEKIKYAVPFGLKVRDENKNNQVSDGMVYSRKDKIMLLADGKYGFRAYDNSISVNLIRSTTDPMLSQENYRHFIKLGIAFLSDGTDFDLLGLRDLFVENGTYIQTDAHEGVLPLSDGWFTLSGKIGLSDIKEYAEGILFCLYGIEDTSEGVIRFEKNIISAVETDGLCNEIEPVGFSEKEICLRIKKGEVKFIFVRLKNSGNIRS